MPSASGRHDSIVRRAEQSTTARSLHANLEACMRLMGSYCIARAPAPAAPAGCPSAAVLPAGGVQQIDRSLLSSKHASCNVRHCPVSLRMLHLRACEASHPAHAAGQRSKPAIADHPPATFSAPPISSSCLMGCSKRLHALEDRTLLILNQQPPTCSSCSMSCSRDRLLPSSPRASSSARCCGRQAAAAEAERRSVLACRCTVLARGMVLCTSARNEQLQPPSCRP